MNVTSNTRQYIADFEITNYVKEQMVIPGLYEVAIKRENSQIEEQRRLIKDLESKFSLQNGSSFSNQVHFQNAPKTPIQRWFPYREGYSIKLVEAFLNELDIQESVFDPFCGSGTTLLASRWNNVASYGIDVNPISVLVAEVENSFYTSKDLDFLQKVIDDLSHLQVSCKIYKTSFTLSDKVFNETILHALLQLKEYIEAIDYYGVQKILTIAWLSIVETVSNVKKEGNGIKYKNRKRTKNGYINIEQSVWEDANFPKDKFRFVVNILVEKLQMMLHDLKHHYGKVEKIPVIFQGDCLQFDKCFNDEIHFTFFSPPYCNCFDYFEIHKVELWLSELVQNRKELKELRTTGFRSNTNAGIDKPIVYHHPTLEKLLQLFDYQKLWHKKIPRVVMGYFDDMFMLLKKLYQQTAKGGHVGIVVGNSAYTGVIIPTDILIADMAQQLGFEVKNILITRHLTTSSQQKQQLESLKSYLRESIILLKK
ncbi:MAG: hypothetical protein R3E32_08470 [Chitinophagales bacterium]